VFSSLLGPQTVTASIPNPDMFVAGIAVKLVENFTVLADYQWTHWAAFDSLQLVFSPTTLLTQTLYQRYKSTNGIRIGTEYEQSKSLTVRAGYLYHSGAAPPQTVTPLLPEGGRNEFTAGLSFKFGPSVAADIAYQYIHQNDRRGRTRDTPNVEPTVALNNGLYTFNAHLFGVSLAFAF
jgi:long-chain fatty acid transport protein